MICQQEPMQYLYVESALKTVTLHFTPEYVAYIFQPMIFYHLIINFCLKPQAIALYEFMEMA